MKRRNNSAPFLLLFVTGVIGLFVVLGLRQQPPAPSSTGSTPTIVQPKNEKTVSLKGDEYAYAWFFQEKGSDVTLLPNYERRLSASEIIEGKDCTYTINGGFYTTEYKPIGLVIAGGETISEYRRNRLFDGFIAIEEDETSSIGLLLPERPREALQAGPLLILENETLPLAIKNDEKARRMVAALTRDGTLVFLTIYISDSVFLGPYLADVPKVVETISAENDWGITAAINLDGGSASYFSNGSFTLSEITPVGSLFCVTR